MASRVASPRMAAATGPKAGPKGIRVLVALGSSFECELLLSTTRRSRQRFEVVACAVSQEQILHCLSRENIDIALIDKDLEDGRLAGLQILPELVASFQKTPVVVLFDRWEDDLIVDAFRGGAAGVFCRSENTLEMLWRCIRAVHAGQVWANSGQMHLLLNTLRRTAPLRAVGSPGNNLLTPRETQVANHAAEGLSNKEIATKLTLSEHTVSNYVFHIYNKLGISNRVELVLYVTKLRQQESRQESFSSRRAP